MRTVLIAKGKENMEEILKDDDVVFLKYTPYQISPVQLMRVALRMRPDRIIVQSSLYFTQDDYDDYYKIISQMREKIVYSAGHYIAYKEYSDYGYKAESKKEEKEEDRLQIIHSLYHLLTLTNEYSSLISLAYSVDEDNEYVIAKFYDREDVKMMVNGYTGTEIINKVIGDLSIYVFEKKGKKNG